jgi:hypothetical protein
MVLLFKRHFIVVLVLVLVTVLPLVHADPDYWIPTYGESWAARMIYLNIPKTPAEAHDMTVQALTIWNAAQLWFASRYYSNAPVYTLKESSNGSVLVVFTDQVTVDSIAHGEKGDTGWTTTKGDPYLTGATVYLVTGKITLYLVLHEFGHVLGLGHIKVESESAKTCIYADLMCHFVYDECPSTLDLYALHLLAEGLSPDKVTLPVNIPYVEFTPTANLRLTLPPSVHAAVDGTEMGAGVFQVALGEYHTISVPQYVTLNDSSRLDFVGWSDGWKYPDYSLDISSDTALAVIYNTQYKATLTSSLSAQKASWYDQGSSVLFSTPPSPQPINSSLSVLGAKWVFDGWYENGQYLSSSSSVSISVVAPFSLEARWHPDYTMPIAIVVATVSAIGASTFLFFRRGKSRNQFEVRQEPSPALTYRRPSTMPSAGSVAPANVPVAPAPLPYPREEKHERHEPAEATRPYDAQARYVQHLANLEELKARGKISEEFYRKFKDEYQKKLAEVAPSPLAPSGVEPTMRKFCMDCGASLPTHATFCNRCGSKQ